MAMEICFAAFVGFALGVAAVSVIVMGALASAIHPMPSMPSPMPPPVPDVAKTHQLQLGRA